MAEPLTKEALEYATGRVEDFARVNLNRDKRGKQNAIEVLLNSFGLDDDLLAELNIWADQMDAAPETGSLMLGLLLGLFVHQFNE